MGAKIRHIAIATQDPEKTANFYKEALGLKEVAKVNSPLADGCFLTDGYINLAILKFKTDDSATTEGAPRYTGIHHFGFVVDNMEEACKKMEKAGAQHRPMAGMPSMGHGRTANVEVKFLGPDGVTVDLSEHGWVTLTS